MRRVRREGSDAACLLTGVGFGWTRFTNSNMANQHPSGTAMIVGVIATTSICGENRLDVGQAFFGACWL